MKYSAVRPNLQTGDIVLFSGKGGISEGIKWVTSCKWSHVGLVLVSKDWDMALLWESTTLSTLKDLETQTKRQGVQLVPLSARIETYTGDASIRHIRKPLVAKQKKALQKFRKAMKGRKYEKSKLELINSA